MKSSARVIIAASLFIFGILPSSIAADTVLAPVGDEKPRNDAYLMKFQDSAALTANTSGYQSTRALDTGTRKSSSSYKAVLPYCGIEYKFGCIQTVEAKLVSESNWEILTPGEKFWNPQIAAYTPNADGSRSEYPWAQWPGDSKIGLPPSEKVRLFSSSSHKHGGGGNYVVKAVMSGNDILEGTYSLNQFSVNIIPVSVVKYDPTIVGSREIFAVENYLFPKNVEFRVSIKLGSLFSQFNGWFFGRVGDAELNLDANSQTLVIRGVSSLTPVQTGYMPYPVPEKYKGSFLAAPNPVNGNLPTYVFSPDNSESVKNWLRYKEFLQIQASYESEVWQIDAAPQTFIEADREFEKCTNSQTGVSGLLTTNATAYLPKPPTWNSKESSLIYQVAGPELLSNGKRNLGKYLLAIRTDVASCLWKSNLKNAKATVQVTDGDGDVQIATTTMFQKDGWLYFTATGFHFSAPKISVKLNSEKIIKITCLKGKSKKIFSGANPSCPSGYKKA